MARTALIAGTASAASNKVNRAMGHGPGRTSQPSTPNLSDENIALLGKLMKLHDGGGLTDAEYDRLKAGVLASA